MVYSESEGSSEGEVGQPQPQREEDDIEFVQLAREALTTPLPSAWKPCKTTDSFELYYFNFRTGETSWIHPVDEQFKGKYKQLKVKRESAGASAAGEAELADGWLSALRGLIEGQYDADGDGRLDAAEIRRLIVAIGNDPAHVEDAIRYRYDNCQLTVL